MCVCVCVLLESKDASPVGGVLKFKPLAPKMATTLKYAIKSFHLNFEFI